MNKTGGRGRKLLALASSYLLASLACFVYLVWPNVEGHVHLPFSSFPWNLVLVPFSPLMAVTGLAYQPMEALVALAMFIAVFALVWKLSTRRVRRDHSA